MNCKVFNLLITLILMSLPMQSAWSQQVYKWEDPKSGVTLYSSEKPHDKFAEAELPEINRAEMQFLPATKKTCNGHNGIDCSLKADIDGSVICKDLFRDSVERFGFMCRYASLTINGVGTMSKAKTITVYVRNSKPISAMKPVVKYKSDLGYTASLEGPEEVLPYAIGEFELQAQDAIIVGSKLDETRFMISCDNCDNASAPKPILPKNPQIKSDKK